MCGPGRDFAPRAGAGGPGRGGHVNRQRGPARDHRREDGRRQNQRHSRGARGGWQNVRIQEDFFSHYSRFQ